MEEIKQLTAKGRREPISWERGDWCLVEFDVKKEVGVQRMHLGEVVGSRGNRVHIVQMKNGDLHEVHEQDMHVLGASELALKEEDIAHVTEGDIEDFEIQNKNPDPDVSKV